MNYRHYKGGEYEVIGIARSINDHELRYVVHRAMGEGSDPTRLWLRPYDEFFGDVDDGEGRKVPRFTLIAPRWWQIF